MSKINSFDEIRTNYYKLASTRLLEKVISEFSYEGIFSPIQNDIDYETYTPNIDSSLYYKFKATKRIYGNLVVHKDSIVRYDRGSQNIADDAIRLIIDTWPITNIDPVTTAHFIKELNNTLYADVAILMKKNVAILLFCWADRIHAQYCFIVY